MQRCERPIRAVSAQQRALRKRAGAGSIAIALALILGFSSLFAASGPQADLAAQSRRGKEALEAGRFEEAISIYEELLKALPKEAGLMMNLGMAFFLAGHYEKAAGHLEAACRLQPDLTSAWLFLGAARLQLGMPGKAVEPLQRVVRVEPVNKNAQQLLADALLNLGRYPEALEHYQRLAQLDAGSARAWYGLGRSYEALSQQAFDALQKTAPESAYWLMLVAETLIAKQRYSNAFYFYRQALEKQPDMRGVHAGLAEVYRKTGHPEWALTEEERERQIPAPDCVSRPLDCAFTNGRHLELVKQGENREGPETLYWLVRAYNQLALEAFGRLGQLPPSVEVHELKAEIYRLQGRYTESVSEWRQALRLAPDDAGLKRELALSLYLARDYEAAKPLLKDLLQGHADSPELNFLYGDIFLQSQEVNRGIPFLRKATERDPEYLAAHSSLARAYLQLGQAAQAIPHLKAALEIDEDGSLHYQLARAYQSVGQPDLAREALKKYQEIQRLAGTLDRQLDQEMKITPPE